MGPGPDDPPPGEGAAPLVRAMIAAVRLLWRRPRVAPSPFDVVYRTHGVELLRYRRPRGAGPAHGTPLLMVPSLINRNYILDLLPGRSLVQHLLTAGFEVYMVDWGRPRAEDRFTTFDDYLDRLLHRCVARAARTSTDGDVTLVGQCLGGTLAVIYAALGAGRVRNLVTLTSPVDFARAGLLGQWTRRSHADVDRIVDGLGNIPAPLLQASFQLLVPTLTARKLMWLHDRLTDDDSVDHFLALETWGNDNVSFPGECFRRYIKDLYQDNLLVGGRLRINGRAVRLEAIRCPVLNVVAPGDHIVPGPTARPLAGLVGAEDSQTWEIPGGHIGAIISRTAARALWPRLTDWLAARSASPGTG